MIAFLVNHQLNHKFNDKIDNADIIVLVRDTYLQKRDIENKI